jgi:hypothetical protein
VTDHPTADPDRDRMYERDAEDEYRRDHPGRYTYAVIERGDDPPEPTPQDRWLAWAEEGRRLADLMPLTERVGVAARRAYAEVRDELRTDPRLRRTP